MNDLGRCATGHAPWARFDDAVARTAQVFAPPYEVLVARCAAEVAVVLDEVDRATRQGAWAFGHVAYEAAAGLGTGPPADDRAAGGPPLAWFGLCGPPTTAPLVCVPPGSTRQYTAHAWRPGWTDGGYRRDVAHVREQIARGEVYQCNLTVRLHSRVGGDLVQLYGDLVLNQRTRYGAYLDLGTHVVLSASPELFFQWQGDRLTTRPMKGTSVRGRTPAEDRQRLLSLTGSDKERAENVMVVDLLRNDLGRVCTVGTVDVPALCVPERYETLWQLTSDVTGTVLPGAGLTEVFRALFPSGSVTGAPKHSAMQIIRTLEPEPRGVYCGAVGVVAPPGEAVRARFSVAIRTLVVDRATGEAVYGTGGGITWSSQAGDELAEVRAKTAILHEPYQEFQLLETMAYLPGTGVRHLDRHLQRLGGSAQYFGYPFDAGDATAQVAAATGLAGPSRVRLVLSRTGALTVGLGPLPAPAPGPVRLAVDPEPVDRTQRWLFHKTSNRQTYVTRARRHPHADDVVLVNELGEVTETTIANLALQLDGTWWTPHVDAGCLPGIERGHLVELGVLSERRLTLADLRQADGIALVSALRGWRPAVLLDAVPEPVSPGVADEVGGDEACWLHRVCPACGRLAQGPPLPVCATCGAEPQ